MPCGCAYLGQGLSLLDKREMKQRAKCLRHECTVLQDAAELKEREYFGNFKPKNQYSGQF